MTAADNYPVLPWALDLWQQFINSSLPPKSPFGSRYMQDAWGATTPVVSVRGTEVQPSFKVLITGIPGLRSGVQQIPFSLLLLIESTCYFPAHKVCWVEDIEACSQSSCYSNRDAISFKMLSQEFTLLVAWLRILRVARCNRPVVVPPSPWDQWRISES